MANRPYPTIEHHEPREDTLPDWAQRKLQLLRRKLADEKTANAALRGDIPETDTLIRHHGIRPDQLLAKGSEITFVPDLARSDRTIDCKLEGGLLTVYAGRDLIVRPRSNNGVALELGR